MRIILPEASFDGNYIAYDELRYADYCFKVKANNIIKFDNFTDALPKTIVLPNLETLQEFSPCKRFLGASLAKSYNMGYLSGVVKISAGCFKGIKRANIVVPSNTSIMLEQGCFDDGACIKFILPSNMAIKHIYQKSLNWTHVLQQDWLILTDGQLTGKIIQSKNLYNVHDYVPSDDGTSCILSVSKKYFVQNGEVLEHDKVLEAEV